MAEKFYDGINWLTYVCQSPKPGDQIEISRFGSRHWAIYVGDGYVVHLTPADGSTGSFFSIFLPADTKKAVVKKEKLSYVAGISNWTVNNKKDRKYKARPVNEIISTANKYVGMEIDYNVATKNCEHFVAELRYGPPDSRQRPKPGDQIEIYRIGYQHWAIYVGDGYVVHLTSADGGTGSFFSIPLSAVTSKAMVKKEKLSYVAGMSSWKVNNEKDRKYNARPAEVVSVLNRIPDMFRS
ncbi:phospholipase A and acyltransferase 2-like isoform X2 [Podarcis raffonei]|uniref:phospholipase A and acyltransferase 2-like isoform X2 n=1 Tax=Podarcis raffonei TaxID=65483 RepID=UPI00232985EE|nr:phospholipase A and acyltransferase 2-like isoform X2 [Podarcis raffonei]